MSPFWQPAAGDRLSSIPVLYLSACVITHYTSFSSICFLQVFKVVLNDSWWSQCTTVISQKRTRVLLSCDQTPSLFPIVSF